MLASKRKRYLSGPDWVISTLDTLMKAATCAGNMSQIVLLIDSPLDHTEVRERLNRFVKKFPVLQGRVTRDFKLTPYWKIPKTSEFDLRVSVSRVDSSTALLPMLEKSANASFCSDNEHLAFHLFLNGNRSALAMTFDHRIFDARGAESFLNMFQKSWNAGNVSGDITFTSTMALTEWKKKFLAGRTVNRRIIALSHSTPESLQLPKEKGKGFKYRLISFSEQETSAIYERAYREAGYLMESPYLLVAVLRTVHDLFKGQSKAGSSYLVPVTMDLRPGRDPLQEMFFNYVSYLFYQVPASEVADRAGLIALLKQQMYDQVKSGFPRDLAEASLLTRIAPLPMLGKLLHFPLKGKMATFAFSHLGKSLYQHTTFLEKGIENIFHMPRVPVPPGLGFFSNYFDGRLNMIISYLDGLITDADAGMLEQGIRQRIGAGQG